MLEKAGLLSDLEEIGILPTKERIEQEDGSWEEEEYPNRETRENVLRYLFLGQIVSASSRTLQLAEQEKDKLLKRLGESFRIRTLSFDSMFDLIVTQTELWNDLERAGLIPAEMEDPNPFAEDLDSQDLFDEDKYGQWWEKHPELEAEFYGNMKKRDEIEGYLYFGSVLGTLSEVRKVMKPSNQGEQD